MKETMKELIEKLEKENPELKAARERAKPYVEVLNEIMDLRESLQKTDQKLQHLFVVIENLITKGGTKWEKELNEEKKD